MVDTAKVLGRFYDGIDASLRSERSSRSSAANAGVPVWNGLTDVDHPTQALADILTLMESFQEAAQQVQARLPAATRATMSPTA